MHLVKAPLELLRIYMSKLTQQLLTPSNDNQVNAFFDFGVAQREYTHPTTTKSVSSLTSMSPNNPTSLHNEKTKAYKFHIIPTIPNQSNALYISQNIPTNSINYIYNIIHEKYKFHYTT